MKKLWLHIILAVLISIGWTVCSQAIDLVPVTSFDSSWTTFTSGTATTIVYRWSEGQPERPRFCHRFRR